MVSACLGKDPRFLADPHLAVGPGPAVAVPLGAAGADVLLLVRAVGEPVFTEADLEPLLAAAGQAALALELALRRRAAEHSRRRHDGSGDVLTCPHLRSPRPAPAGSSAR
ncbi:hypothetical protein [Streptomyces cyaneofuscatus]|uniref:hypothetical protein n=1 Tax=Streptomyces cyaneofuscatus TaxID=66883 RepID=UPI0037A23EA6